MIINSRISEHQHQESISTHLLIFQIIAIAKKIKIKKFSFFSHFLLLILQNEKFWQSLRDISFARFLLLYSAITVLSSNEFSFHHIILFDCMQQRHFFYAKKYLNTFTEESTKLNTPLTLIYS